MSIIDDVVYGVQGDIDKENVYKSKKLWKAEEWRRKRRAQFETSKYVLVHYTRNTRKTTDAAVSINGTTIHATSEAKYILGNNLR